MIRLISLTLIEYDELDHVAESKLERVNTRTKLVVARTRSFSIQMIANFVL